MQNLQTELYNPFNDIKIVTKLDTRVNFIIKCENDEELFFLMSKIGVNKRSITFKEYESNINKQQPSIFK